jgi:hypothetical protein
MKFSKSIILLVVALLSASSYQVFAQERDKDRDNDKDRARQLERDHQVNRDMDRYRDRDRFNDGMGGVIYGAELMTERERTHYREQLQTASSEQQRNQIRLQHQKEIQSRELNKEEYEDGMGEIIYGAWHMTEQERKRYRDQVQNANSEQDRNNIIKQHQKKMQLRERSMEQYKDGMGGTIYGGWHMTEQERRRYREQLKAATSEQQRNEIRMQHRKEIHLREQDKES